LGPSNGKTVAFVGAKQVLMRLRDFSRNNVTLALLTNAAG